MQIRQILEDASCRLRDLGIENSRVDAELLLGHCLNMSRTQLYLNSGTIVTQKEKKLFYLFLARREAWEPVAYILGEKEFWSKRFMVSRDVLIPRPETEFLLEKVFELSEIDQREDGCCLDLCTGSGVIAVILALELQKDVIALDISQKALEVVKQNVIYHKVNNFVTPLQSDLFANLGNDKRFSLIVSNPPYVGREEIRDTVSRDVRDYEPHIALDGGDTGLEIIDRIADSVLHHLKDGGDFFMEFGCDQAEDVKRIFSQAEGDGKSFSTIRIFKDYSGRDRVLFARAHTK